MRNKHMIRTLAVLLAVMLCMTAFSTVAFASDGETATTSEAQTEPTDSADITGDDLSELISALFGSIGTEKSGKTGIVTTNGGKLNVRTGAGLDNYAFTQLPNGTVVEVVGTDGDWYMVRLPEKIGYVYSGYMTLSDTGGENDSSFSFSIDPDKLSELFEQLMGGSGGAALTPESDKIYVILSEGEYQNKTYRWSGTTYAVIGNDLAIGETASTAYRGDRGKTAYDHSQSAHAPADAEKNVQSDWNETDGNSDAFIKNKPAIPKAVTKTVQTLSDAASKSFTVTGYILSVILIDSATKEQVIGDISFENATTSANGKVTVTLAAAPSNPILVIITSIAL